MSIKTNEFLYDLFCKVLKINEALAFCEVKSGQFLAQMYTKQITIVKKKLYIITK
jgi:hypothetical protein